MEGALIRALRFAASRFALAIVVCLAIAPPRIDAQVRLIGVPVVDVSEDFAKLENGRG